MDTSPGPLCEVRGLLWPRCGHIPWTTVQSAGFSGGLHPHFILPTWKLQCIFQFLLSYVNYLSPPVLNCLKEDWGFPSLPKWKIGPLLWSPTSSEQRGHADFTNDDGTGRQSVKLLGIQSNDYGIVNSNVRMETWSQKLRMLYYLWPETSNHT